MIIKILNSENTFFCYKIIKICLKSSEKTYCIVVIPTEPSGQK